MDDTRNALKGSIVGIWRGRVLDFDRCELVLAKLLLKASGEWSNLGSVSGGRSDAVALLKGLLGDRTAQVSDLQCLHTFELKPYEPTSPVAPGERVQC
jgi:hypothetical protein